MFRDLYAVARHTPLHLIITPNGEQLKIIVTPKPSGDAADNPALAKPFSAIGTPEELDREFPDALKKYAGAVNELRTSIDLPLDALEAAKKKTVAKEEKKAEKKRQEEEEAKRRSESAKKAAETRAQKAAGAKAEKERKAKERADAKAAKKAAKSAPRGGIQAPGMKAQGSDKSTAWPFPIGQSPEAETAGAEAKHLPGLPGKEECIRDYQQLKLKHGDKLTRRLFIKKSETGRRYEKLWKNWDTFLKDANAQQQLALGEPTTAAAQASPVSEKAPLPPKGEEQPVAVAPDTKPDTLAVLERKTKRLLGTYTGAANVGDVIRLNDQTDPHQLDAVVPGVELHAHRVLEPAWAVFTEKGATIAYTREIHAAGEPLDQSACIAAPGFAFGDEGLIVHEVHEHDRAYTVKSARPKFQVYDDDGVLVAEFKWPPSVGERLDVDEFPHAFRVETVEGQRVTARKVLKVKKLLVDEGGSRQGETDEMYEIADQVAELTDREWRVVKIEDTAYFVKAAKPRIKGPVAAAAPVTTE